MKSPAEVVEENNRQRYLARRRQAQRGLGAESEENRAVGAERYSTQGSGVRQTRGGSAPGSRQPVRTPVIRHSPTPWLAAAVVASLGGLFVLAVLGAYDLMREVFGR